MREIKLRVWVISEKLMVYPNKNFPIYIDNGEWEKGQVPMQYTGLKDKNGKEIYEGDVVLIEGMNKVIKWHEYGGWVTRPKTGFYFEDDMINGDEEIIGNIYENPELIK